MGSRTKAAGSASRAWRSVVDSTPAASRSATNGKARKAKMGRGGPFFAAQAAGGVPDNHSHDSRSEDRTRSAAQEHSPEYASSRPASPCAADRSPAGPMTKRPGPPRKTSPSPQPFLHKSRPGHGAWLERPRRNPRIDLSTIILRIMNPNNRKQDRLSQGEAANPICARAIPYAPPPSDPRPVRGRKSSHGGHIPSGRASSSPTIPRGAEKQQREGDASK